MTVDIPIKALYDDVTLPTRGSEYAAGYDLYCYAPSKIKIYPHETVKVKTGISAEFPEGTFGAIFARSGLATNKGLRPANCVGVIDSDYRGEILVPIHNDSEEVKTIEPKERIAQLILLPFVEMNFIKVDNLNETKRGEGGFGSTGTK